MSGGLTAAATGVAAAQVGKGSFATSLPSGESEPQGTIYATDEVSAPIQTNEWWSSLLWNTYGENLFWHPGYGNPTDDGLEIGYPSEWSFENADAVLSYATDVTLGHSQGTFGDALVAGWSDWGVDVRWGDGTGETLDVTLVQGSPFAFAEYAGGDAVLEFTAAPTVWADRGNVLGVTVDGTSYGLFAPAGTTWDGLGSATLTNDLQGTDGAGYLTVAVLPDDAPATLDTFRQYAYNVVTDTTVTPSYDRDAGRVTTTFAFETDPKPESTASGTIAALYPHQHKYTDASLLSDTYASPRGTMRTVAGSSFETTYRFPGVLPGLPDVGGYDDARLQGYVSDVSASIDDSQGSGTYWTGKNYGRLANAALIAEQVGNTAKRDGLRTTIRTELEDWLTADDGESATLFYYNDTWGTLIGYPDSFGSGANLNDHHFHYGYFVRGAAELARTDPEWAAESNWGGMVELLLRDYANWERPSGSQDPTSDPAGSFPFLRQFSPYAGHSWAAGAANFPDGNNQESSSEAIQAYGSMVRYAVHTGHDAMLEWAVYLYTTAVTAALEYWFDVDDDTHPADWAHDTAGIVWGSKVSHATWFSGDPEAIHGINYLPFDGHSLYLGWDTDAAGRNYDELVAENGAAFDYWPDIVWNYRAFSDPQDAADMFDARANSYSPEFGETKAHTYHWIRSLLELGSPVRNVTADHPLAHVFDDGSERTYVAYNSGDAATTVTFSDGTTLTVSANSFATQRGSGSGAGDTAAPTAPSTLSAPCQTATSVHLDWDAATDTGDSGLDYYTVYRDGESATQVDAGTTSTTVSDLSPRTEYTFTVTATDGAGNESDAAEALAVTTDPESNADFSQEAVRISGPDGTEDDLRFEFVSTVDSAWVDVHYTVNGGTQYNHRMNNARGDTHTLETVPDSVVGDFDGGDVVAYSFTYEADGGATDSEAFSITY